MPETLSPAAWYQSLATYPQAGFCHTPAWGRIVREVWGGEVQAAHYPMPDGQIGLLPMVRRRVARGLLQWTVSGETGVYGGPLLQAPLPESAWETVWRGLSKSFGAMTLFVPPGQTVAVPRRGELIWRETHRLALTEAPTQRYNRGLKARLNRARRVGLHVTEGTDAAAIAIYDQLYRDTLSRWGPRLSWVRPTALFQAMHQHGYPQVRLWLAWAGEQPVAGIWVAQYGEEAHYLAGATGEDGLQLGGSHLLLDHAVHLAVADGCRVFDFGPSVGWPGLIQFKTSFGAEPVPYAEVRLWTPPVRLYWACKQGTWGRPASAFPATAAHAATAATEEVRC